MNGEDGRATRLPLTIVISSTLATGGRFDRGGPFACGSPGGQEAEPPGDRLEMGAGARRFDSALLRVCGAVETSGALC